MSEPRLTSESQAMLARDHAEARQGCTPEHQLGGENESHRNGIVGQMAPRCQSDFLCRQSTAPKSPPPRAVHGSSARLRYGRSQTDMCFGLSLVNGERFQSAQRSQNLMPAISAMRSSSAGHAYRNGESNRPAISPLTK